MPQGVVSSASPRVSRFFVSRECEGRLGEWLLRRAPECQDLLKVASARDTSGGGCFSEPPSVKLFCKSRVRGAPRRVGASASPRVSRFVVSRECGGRLRGWLLRRAP